jgi:hypothetical protein
MKKKAPKSSTKKAQGLKTKNTAFTPFTAESVVLVRPELTWRDLGGGKYAATDPITEGEWRVITKRPETSRQLSARVDFVLSTGTERPPKGQAHTLIASN